MSNKSSSAQQAISLPKGGGSLQGMGETFQANLFSGTGSYSVPIATSAGRHGFGPTLSLQYSSANGNGPFGSGWQLSIPRVSRKTEKGLPRYDDSDVFVMSGAEDLVPCLEKFFDSSAGRDIWIAADPLRRGPYTIYRYRPRTEGLFARIERWQHDATREVHWRAISRDNVTSIYGATAASRIADPDDEHKVSEWLLQETYDGAGNHILYEYARDDPRLYGENGAFAAGPSERNRNATQLYIRRIYYGNFPDPLTDAHGNPITYPTGAPVGPLRGGRRYGFEVVFDYGDWDLPTKDPHPEAVPEGAQELFGADSVPIRTDRFSSFRSCFEIRTLRRCRRVLMVHHFAELGAPTLVRSTDFEYRSDPDTLLSLLTAITVTSYRRDQSMTYRSASMPPVTFDYAEFRPHQQRYRALAANGDDLPPTALNNPDTALVDLFGDGMPDVLQSGPGGFRYWKNLGDGLLDRPRTMAEIPAAITLAQPGVAFGDMAGDGRADLLVHAGPLPGFYESTADGAWQTFKAYDEFPSFDLADPNLRLLDLTGDGASDALLTREADFLWFECLGEKGFGAPQSITRAYDAEQFPDVFFGDPGERVRLADMNGDGLNDIVLVHSGRIDYWPNLGYGRFGKRITMENAPRLEIDFDPKRLFLADLNGTGCADLVYVDFDRVLFWFNQCGNRWSDTAIIAGTPAISDADAIQFADVFGTGTATLVWSYDRSAHPDGNFKALDFCGGVKPYVLTEMSNNMGATTRVRYAPSTRYFLEDQANGTPWVTKLPFPVQCVDRVEVVDHVSRTKLVSTYKYHHGYFDGREREFRGFARVDQFDTESFEDFTSPGLHGSGETFGNNSFAYHAPPVETRSWFHTGIYFDEDSRRFADGPFDDRELTSRLREEFYRGDEEAFPRAENEVASGETPHQAYRALRGALLRTEIYARDGSAKADHPYQVTENRYRVSELQPRGGNQHAVYFSRQMESFSYHYERNPRDPRISHSLALETDPFGNVLRSLAIAYGRRRPDPDLPTQADRDRQAQTLITYTENSFTNAIDEPLATPDDYRTPLPAETRTYELTGFSPADDGGRFTFDEWTANDFARIAGAVEIGYEENADPGQEQKRLLEHARTYYRKDDLTELLALGGLESLALPGESCKLAFTPELITQIYGDRVSDSMLASDGAYVHTEGDLNWWIPSGRFFYSPDAGDTPAGELAFARRHFFTARRSRDPFGSSALMSYDPYDLLFETITDALGNRTSSEHDYRLLQPFRVTDPNGNRAEVAFDTLGLVAGSAVMGKVTENKGDSLAGFVADLTPQQRKDFLDDPLGSAAALLGNATSRFVYDLERYRQAGQPVFAAVLARETHASDPLPPGGLKIQVSLSYSDGFGREIQKKVHAEPGPLVDGGAIVDPRWVGSGWTLFDNKGKPVRRYEPFFDATHEFQFGNTFGVSSTVFYDPLVRAVATLHPPHTWEKTVFDAWRQESWDVNDTSLLADPKDDPDVGAFFARLAESDYLPTWFEPRQTGSLGIHEQGAALKTAMHAGTPSFIYADSLGRPFLTVADNRFERNGVSIEEEYRTRTILDIEGMQRGVTDAKQRLVVRYRYDMTGTRAHEIGMDSGERWMLSDVTGNAIYAWDHRDHRLRTRYDPLRRPLDLFVRPAEGSELLVSRTVYGETAPNSEAGNLRGRVFQLFDQSGVLLTDHYDFKGNVVSSRRRLAREYKSELDWSIDPVLEPEVFVSRASFDAFNRPITVTTPDGSSYRTHFDQSRMIRKVDVQLHGAATETSFVAHVHYNAKGQRMRIEYGNGVRTAYAYDPLTFKLTAIRTARGAEILQDLVYTYDAIGHITHIQDNAQQEIYFNNQVVRPDSDYVYDSVYRLIAASGREHIGQAGDPATSWSDEFRVQRQHPQDGGAMRRYTEQYHYDAASNFHSLIHQFVGGSWSRDYVYDETSFLEAGERGNRLTSTAVGQTGEPYSYDAHGNMTRMAHVSAMSWDFRDQLRHVNLAGGGHAYYVYDAGGQRVRKVVEKNGGTLVEERIYLGALEVFRRRDSSGTISLERQTLHVMDDKQRVALAESRTLGDDGSPALLVRYQFGNHLGSANLELDDRAEIISYEEYYAYGGTAYQAVRSLVDAPKRYRYGAMERDEESGFGYHTARYYLPWLGRWASSDPIGIADGVNTYCSFHNNPVLFRDPAGLQNTPGNFVEYANSVEQGLNRMAELGLEKGKEFGLAQDPKTKKLMVLEGSSREIHFGRLIPLGHTHTGLDTTSYPSTADLNEFARKKVKEHWIFSTDEGWARLRYDAKTKTFDVLANRGENAVRFTIFQNPDFNPRDRTPMNQAQRWKQSVGDIQGKFTVEPPQSRGGGPAVKAPGFSWPRWGLRLMVGSQIAAGTLVMLNRYKNSIQADIAAGTGGAKTLDLVKNDTTAIAIAQGIASFGPGPRRAVGAAGTFFVATELSKMIFGEDDTLRYDPYTNREIRWFYKPIPEVEGMVQGTMHVIDSKTGQWAPARMYCASALDSLCPYLTEREIQELNDPWR